MNFKALLDGAVAGRQLVRSLAYVVTTGDSEETPFFEALRNAAFETRMKDLQVFAGGAKKGDWDIGIVMDAIRLAPSIDALVLATGDGDFVPLVEYLQSHFGIQVEVMAFEGSMAGSLREQADDFTNLGVATYLMHIPGSGRSQKKKTEKTTKPKQTKQASKPTARRKRRSVSSADQ